MAKKQDLFQIYEQIKKEFNLALEEEKRKEEAAKLKRQKKVTAQDVVKGLDQGFKNYEDKKKSNKKEVKTVANHNDIGKRNSNEEKFKKAINLRDIPSKIESKLQPSTEGLGMNEMDFSKESETIIKTDYYNKEFTQELSKAGQIGDKLRGKHGREKAQEAFILSQIFSRRF